MNRFESAVNKLYKAYNEGTLNADRCYACAVGNIVGHGHWVCGSPSSYLQSEGGVNNMTMYTPNNSGYSNEELAMVEYIFIMEHKEAKRENYRNKELQYNGLIAVINYLAELDGIKTIDEEVKQFKQVLERELA